MFRLSQTCFFLLLLQRVVSEVFLSNEDASQMLSRKKRANSPFEEWRKGNMERECVEERCDWEEAREIFENDELTNEFWNKYADGKDACEDKPCINGGQCKDGINKYSCLCRNGFQGTNCEIEIRELCENKNGGCDHFCKVDQGQVECSCAGGYFLDSDGRTCSSNEAFRCGGIKDSRTRSTFIYNPDGNSTAESSATNDTVDTVTNYTAQINIVDVASEVDTDYQSNITPSLEDLYAEAIEAVIEPEIEHTVAADTRIVNGEFCPPGECPWQALLVNPSEMGFCGGTILNEYFILTAAHCMNRNITRSFYVVLGEFDTRVSEGREAKHYVDQVLIHKHYKADTFNNDIALIKLDRPINYTDYIVPACLPELNFAENVLMRQTSGRISGFGRVGENKQPSPVLLRLSVPFVARATCMESSSHRISTRMFCAGYDRQAKDACQGDSGGPHVTRYGNTWFVTGVVSWGEGCAREGKYGVYTQVSKYLRWIHDVFERFLPKDKEKAKRKKRRVGPTTLWV